MAENSFSSNVSFIVASIGAAVGLGNIWRFPYLAARHGGGIFILVYILMLITLGTTLMMTDIALGRRVQKGVVQVFRDLNNRWMFVGVLAVVVSILFCSFYCVIGGWITKYVVVYVSGCHLSAGGDEYFGTFLSNTSESMLWFCIYLFLNFVLSVTGVRRGIENLNKILMPIFLVLLLGLTIYTLTFKGAWEGVYYYLVPDFSELTARTFLAAASQVFFSLGLGLGLMITFGAYMGKRGNIQVASRQIEWADTVVSLISGLMVIPAVFVFSNGAKEALNQGPGLLFITMPKAFNSMGYWGSVAGLIFFVIVFFAAITSSVAIIETIVVGIHERFRVKRTVACLICIGILFLLGLPSVLGYGLWNHVRINGMVLLDFFDFIANGMCCPIIALLTCIFVGYVVGTKVILDEVEVHGDVFRQKRMYTVMVKYIAPVLLILIFSVGILQTAGAILAF